jgi:hypothetical protein
MAALEDGDHPRVGISNPWKAHELVERPLSSGICARSNNFLGANIPCHSQFGWRLPKRVGTRIACCFAGEYCNQVASILIGSKRRPR